MYRSYKNFNLDLFSNTLKIEFYSFGNKNLHALFEGKLVHVLNKEVPLQTKLLLYNNNALMFEKLKKVLCYNENSKILLENIVSMKSDVNVCGNLT